MTPNRKKVYYSNLGLHTYMEDLIKHPPEGYEFIVNTNERTKGLVGRLRNNKLMRAVYKNFIKKTFNVFNIMKKMNYEESPEGIDLIFSTSTIVNEKKPWIVKILDLSPFALAGNDYDLFIKNRKKLESSLASPYCKKIIVHTNEAKKTMEKYFSSEVLKKVIKINPAIPIKSKKINTNKKDVTFLFMGSINNPEEFLIKGGLETLETFKVLDEKYKNVKLIVKCRVPEEIKKKFTSKNISYIDGRLTVEELDKVYEQSDVLIMPGYCYFVMAYLEAFSHNMPIIALDTYGVAEFIADGKNGYIVKPSDKIPIQSERYPPNMKSKEFLKAIMDGDERVISDLAAKASKLIESPELLMKMKKECQKLMKEKYSFENKRAILKEIFDEALK